MLSTVRKSRSARFRGVLAAWLCIGLICACAAPPRQGEEKAATPAETDRPAAGPPGEPTSEEVMYRVFAGEYLGAEGDLQGAVGEYLEAALASDDPAIARRATRVAFAAEAWQQATMCRPRSACVRRASWRPRC